MSDRVMSILLRVALGREVSNGEVEEVVLAVVRHRPDLARCAGQEGVLQAMLNGDQQLAQFWSALLDSADACA